MADMGAVSDFLATVAGGGAAGYLDQKYDKKVAGLTIGTLVGLGAAGIGLTKYAGRFKGKLLAVGEGALAGEAYRMVSNRVNAGSVQLPAGDQSVQGVRGMRSGMRGVGALPAPQHIISREELVQSLQALRAG